MAEDPTMIATLVNMMMTGCQMHENVFTVMGKGKPIFEVQGNHLLLTLSDGTYKIDVVYHSSVTNDPPVQAAQAN